jgi:hypothetical protein
VGCAYADSFYSEQVISPAAQAEYGKKNFASINAVLRTDCVAPLGLKIVRSQ